MTRLPRRNTAETKTHPQMLLAFAVVSMGVLLVFVSFSVPPTGIIDASVLAAFGEMLTFPAPSSASTTTTATRARGMARVGKRQWKGDFKKETSKKMGAIYTHHFLLVFYVFLPCNT